MSEAEKPKPLREKHSANDVVSTIAMSTDVAAREHAQSMRKRLVAEYRALPQPLAGADLEAFRVLVAEVRPASGDLIPKLKLTRAEKAALAAPAENA